MATSLRHPYRRGNTAAVWEITDANQTVVCYTALSMSAVDRSARRESLGNGAPRLTSRRPCRAVVITALNADAMRWWQRFGFERLDADDANNMNLYLLTNDIAEALAIL